MMMIIIMIMVMSILPILHCAPLSLPHTFEQLEFNKANVFGDDVCDEKDSMTTLMTLAVSLIKCCSLCNLFSFTNRGTCYAVRYTMYDKTCRLILYGEYKLVSAQNNITCVLYQINPPMTSKRQAIIENITLLGINQLAPMIDQWIVVQQRVDDSISFERDWNDYKQGFGNLKTNFWFGLENMSKLSTTNTTLRIEALSRGVWYVDMYRQFKISPEAEGYKIHVDDYFGNNGDVIRTGYTARTEMQDMKFSTPDEDNDLYCGGSCAGRSKSGWWFHRCHSINLNGPYTEPGNFRYYITSSKRLVRITTCRMMISS